MTSIPIDHDRAIIPPEDSIPTQATPIKVTDDLRFQIEARISEQTENSGSFEYLLQIPTKNYFDKLMIAINYAQYKYVKIPNAPMVRTRSTTSSGSTMTENEITGPPFLVQNLYIGTKSGDEYNLAILRKRSAQEDIFHEGLEMYSNEVNAVLKVYDVPLLDPSFIRYH